MKTAHPLKSGWAVLVFEKRLLFPKKIPEPSGLDSGMVFALAMRKRLAVHGCDELVVGVRRLHMPHQE